MGASSAAPTAIPVKSIWRSMTSTIAAHVYAGRRPTASSSVFTAWCWTSSFARPFAPPSARRWRLYSSAWTPGCFTTTPSARITAIATWASALSTPSRPISKLPARKPRSTSRSVHGWRTARDTKGSRPYRPLRAPNRLNPPRCAASSRTSKRRSKTPSASART